MPSTALKFLLIISSIALMAAQASGARTSSGSAALAARSVPPFIERCTWCPDEATGVCVFLSSSDANCGACSALCSNATVCRGGQCISGPQCCREYAGGASFCGTGDPTRCTGTPQDCSACGDACPASKPFCTSGTCAECEFGQIKCGGRCVPIDDANCGSCESACTNGTQCRSGDDGLNPTCRPIICEASYDTYCPGIGCVWLNFNDTSCGKCGSECPAGTVCSSGACVACSAVPPIEGTFTLCGSTCAQLSSDPLNCGSCGTICSPGQSCISGSCGCPPFGGQASPNRYASCPAANGTVFACVDLNNDASNCGACGSSCPVRSDDYPYPGFCVGGKCTCTPPNSVNPIPGNLTPCGGVCAPTTSDPKNCGGCGTACDAGEGCLEGECFPCSRIPPGLCPAATSSGTVLTLAISTAIPTTATPGLSTSVTAGLSTSVVLTTSAFATTLATATVTAATKPTTSATATSFATLSPAPSTTSRPSAGRRARAGFVQFALVAGAGTLWAAA